MRHPLKGPKCGWKDYFGASWAQRWPAIWSAGLLALGNFGYASAGDSLGYAIGYALSRGTLLVSALLGVFVYKEFSGLPHVDHADHCPAAFRHGHSAGSIRVMLVFVNKAVYTLHRCLQCGQTTDQFFIS